MDLIDQILGANRAVAQIGGGNADGSGGGVTIDLADYGVNVFGLFLSGGGTVALTDADTLWEKVEASTGMVTLVGEYNGMTLQTQMSRLFGGNKGLTATIPLYYSKGRYVVYLYVIDDNVEMYLDVVKEA